MPHGWMCSGLHPAGAVAAEEASPARRRRSRRTSRPAARLELLPPAIPRNTPRSAAGRGAGSDRRRLRGGRCGQTGGSPCRTRRRPPSDRNSLSASPSGRPDAASIVAGRVGVKASRSSASTRLGTATIAASAAMAPFAVSTRNRGPLRSMRRTGQPRRLGTPAAWAAITVPVALDHPEVHAAVVVAAEIAGRYPVEFGSAHVGADGGDQLVPAAARLEKACGGNVRYPLGASASTRR